MHRSVTYADVCAKDLVWLLSVETARLLLLAPTYC